MYAFILFALDSECDATNYCCPSISAMVESNLSPPSYKLILSEAAFGQGVLSQRQKWLRTRTKAVDLMWCMFHYDFLNSREQRSSWFSGLGSVCALSQVLLTLMVTELFLLLP